MPGDLADDEGCQLNAEQLFMKEFNAVFDSAVTIRLFQTRFDSIHLQKIAIRFDFDFPCKKKFNVKVGKALVNYNF